MRVDIKTDEVPDWVKCIVQHLYQHYPSVKHVIFDGESLKLKAINNKHLFTYMAVFIRDLGLQVKYVREGRETWVVIIPKRPVYVI